MIKLIKRVIPSWTSIESQYLVFLSVLLVIRTMMSIWLADVNGRIVKAIVEKNWPLFVQRVSDVAPNAPADFQPLPVRCALIHGQFRH